MSSHSHLPHCRVLPRGEFNVMIPELHVRVTLQGASTGWIQWHVIPKPRITLQGAATWWIHCHDSRATCHIAGCKNSVRHIENRFSLYFIFLFLMQFRLWRAAAFVLSPIHLFARRQHLAASPITCYVRVKGTTNVDCRRRPSSCRWSAALRVNIRSRRMAAVLTWRVHAVTSSSAGCVVATGHTTTHTAAKSLKS